MSFLFRYNTSANRNAFLLWTLLATLLMALTAWQLHATRMDALQRLHGDAQRMAVRSAQILAVPAWEVNEVSARSIIMAEMEDSRVYAMVVHDRQGFLEGQRRNEHWEPVPWDDLVPDSMVEAHCPLLLEEQPVGSVQVYLSPRLLEEDIFALWWREMARFALSLTAVTLVLGSYMWRNRRPL